MPVVRSRISLSCSVLLLCTLKLFLLQFCEVHACVRPSEMVLFSRLGEQLSFLRLRPTIVTRVQFYNIVCCNILAQDKMVEDSECQSQPIVARPCVQRAAGRPLWSGISNVL